MAVTHLDCTRCGLQHPAGTLLNLCTCGGPLFARYDLARAAHEMRPGHLALRQPTLWRYHDVLPVDDPANRVSLGEGFTPLLPAPRLAAAVGLPRLFVKDDDSLAEMIQRAHPAARVVKSLNTMNNSLMVDPGRLGEATTVFVSGDDSEAKAVVTGLLQEMGHEDVLDLGGLETARGVEMWLPLWIRIAQSLDWADFNIRVVRESPSS